MRDHLIPHAGQHRLYDLQSESTSLEAKASAARWYAEMMIDLFFSVQGKEELGEEAFNRLSLGDKIKKIRPHYSQQLIDSLNLIKQFGDMASHYKPDRILDEKDVANVIDKSLSLFDFALIDIMKDRGIRKTEVTATLFSTFLPSIRIRVLKEILDLQSVKGDCDDDMFLLDKLVLALTKNGEAKKAIRTLESLKKKERIGDYHINFWKEKVDIIQGKIEEGVLPIPQNISDCKRNFEDVLRQLSEEDKIKNEELIQVFNTMLAQVEPSKMGDKQPSLMVLM